MWKEFIWKEGKNGSVYESQNEWTRVEIQQRHPVDKPTQKMVRSV